MSEPWESFWDRAYRAGDHVEHWDAPAVPGELAALVAAGLASPGAAALDVGCGSGLEAVFLARAGLAVIGVDSSRAALELARERAEAEGIDESDPRLDLRLGSALDLPVAAASIDLVIDRGCLHCIDREDRPEYAAEVDRVLKPGGLALLRGARRDDDEQGVVAVTAADVDTLFPAPAYTRGPVVPIELQAQAGNLPGNLVLVRKRSAGR